MKNFGEAFFIAVVSMCVAVTVLSFGAELPIFKKTALGAFGGGIGAWLGIFFVLRHRKRKADEIAETPAPDTHL